MIIRALVLFLTGKLPQALEQIITVLKTDPDNETAKAIRSRIKTVARLKEEGDTLYKDGEWKDAIARWDTALEVGPPISTYIPSKSLVFSQYMRTKTRAEEGCFDPCS